MKVKFSNLKLIALLIGLISAQIFTIEAQIIPQVGLNFDPSFVVYPATEIGARVRPLVRLPDGRILLVGQFDLVGGAPRSGLAMINADGSLDASFLTNTTIEFGTVNAAAFQSDGKLIVGGTFLQVNGAPRRAIMRLNADGSLDSSFTTQINQGSVFEIAVSADDKILVGGTFIDIGGVSRHRFARLNADGSVDMTFSTQNEPNSFVSTIVLQPDGKILIAGNFSQVNGQVFKVARLNQDGTLDASFGAQNFASGSISHVKLQADGKILAAGPFDSFNGVGRSRLARLNADGSLDTTFVPALVDTNCCRSASLYRVEVQPDGKIVIGGDFDKVGAAARPDIARLNADGSNDTTFSPPATTGNPSVGGGVNGIIVLPDGKIVIGGDIFRYGNVRRSNIARINGDGSLDTAFDPIIGARSWVETVAVQADNKVLIGGPFTIVHGQRRNNIARLNAGGSLDTSFVPSDSINATVYKILPETDGKILVGGVFCPTQFGSNPCGFTRLNADGSRDTSFNSPVILGGVFAITKQTDGKILIGGTMQAVSTEFRRHLARLNADGSLDLSFAPLTIFAGSDANVRTVYVHSDGKIYIGGVFETINDTMRKGIARINSDGSLDTSFPAGGGLTGDVGIDVYKIGATLNNKILVAGLFTGFNGTPRSKIMRLNPDGTLDAGFNATFPPGGFGRDFIAMPNGDTFFAYTTTVNSAATGGIARLDSVGNIKANFYLDQPPSGFPHSIALQGNNRIIYGGLFSRTNGVDRWGIAALTFAPVKVAFDYDGDGKADLSVFRPSAGSWYISNSLNNSLTAVQFGANGDLIAPADFDGDGKTDICVFRPGDGGWYRLNSSNNTFSALQFGISGDLPAPGDFDGDGKADITVYRPSAGSWYRINSSNNQFAAAQFGVAEDKPLVGDFDGDGKSDLAVFRPSNGTWYRINSATDTFSPVQFGATGDLPVAADYDGDGKTDIAVYRPSVGDWYIINSSNSSFTGLHFGVTEDKPSPADFDGDGKADFVVFRPSAGTWYLLRTTAGFTGFQFGTNGDIPTPNAFVR